MNFPIAVSEPSEFIAKTNKTPELGLLPSNRKPFHVAFPPFALV
jgi:hypothetical protein